MFIPVLLKRSSEHAEKNNVLAGKAKLFFNFFVD